MTFKEAKKILEKEGFILKNVREPVTASEDFMEYESPEICEAMQVVGSCCCSIMMFGNVFDARKARLKKEYEKKNGVPCKAENRIKEDSGVNPALDESASQFNDALLDEQTKKIKRLGKEIAKLNGIIHDENAILSDVAEELRLTKIREKNLTEVGQKYMKENEELREKVAEKTKLVEMVRKGSKEYCEYGIAAEKMIQKMAKVIVGKGFICSEDFEKYCLWANGYRFNPQLPDFSEEEEKKLSLFRDDSVGAVTNQKDCSPVKDTHSAVDIAEEGADLSGVIVLCGKDVVDVLKKVKDVWQE